MLRPAYLKRLATKALKLTRLKGWTSKYPKILEKKELFNSDLAANYFASLLESRLVLYSLSFVSSYQLFLLLGVFVRNGLFLINNLIY